MARPRHGRGRTRPGIPDTLSSSLRSLLTSAKLTPQTLPVAQAKSRHTRGLPEHTGRGRYYYYCIYSHLPCCFHNTRSRRFFFANLLFSGSGVDLLCERGISFSITTHKAVNEGPPLTPSPTVISCLLVFDLSLSLSLSLSLTHCLRGRFLFLINLSVSGVAYM